MQLHIPIPFSYAVGRVAPTADLSQDITSTSAMFEGGVTTAAFRRERVTGDPSDVSLEQCVYFLYAWGGAFNVSTQEIMYHGSASREASGTVICLPSASVCPGKWVTRSALMNCNDYSCTKHA